DFNHDGKTDLIVGAYGYSPSISYTDMNTGRVYIYYADGTSNFVCATSPCVAPDADVIIDGSTGSYLGKQIVTGDFNTDGTMDFAVGSPFGITDNAGRIHIFYADGTNNFGTAVCSGTPALCSATNADVTIMSETVAYPYFAHGFGGMMASGDLNNDGTTDLAIGMVEYGEHDYNDNPVNHGRVYLIYNNGPYPADASSSDVIIVGAYGLELGSRIAIGDVNRDHRADLIVTKVGTYYWHYLEIFLNDGSYPTSAGNANGIAGDAGFNYPAYTALPALSPVVFGDFNADGYDDMVVSDAGYNTNKGKVSLYTTNDSVVTGEATNNYFGSALASGDFNFDGRTDLAVGAYGNASNTGKVYLFYNDGSLPSSASSADAIISGENISDRFGVALSAMDFNTDGRTDLVVGSSGYSSNAGGIYLFANTGTGTYPASASGRDAIIVGETANSYLGTAFATGDVDGDGWTDLISGAYGYSSNAGRVYVFYADGVYPATADLADGMMTGTTGILLGSQLATGDFDADGDRDIAVSATGYSSSLGRVYMFYNTGSGTFPSTVATASVTITGVAASIPVPCYYYCVSNTPYFGSALASGDWNSDGKTDLVVGSYNYGYNGDDDGYWEVISGRVYFFYNDNEYPVSASSADAIMTPTGSAFLGYSFSTGDFNADGSADLAVNGIYFYYNDGGYPSNAGSDMWITSYGGIGPSVAGDWDSDGKMDLATGLSAWGTNTGRVMMMITEARTVDRFQLLRFRGSDASSNPIRFKGNIKVK
ncbi:MAG: FG-GAP-like repeat-containing protein, partial [Candidatus Moranbacteria bacterium]|nr:FG-GAP-like repeat-containing protein [Candidatus Moranbacteria bacterium]